MTAPDMRTGRGASTPPLRLLAPVVPYAAVGVGIYLLHSAWASFLVYQIAMILVLSVEREWHRVPGLMKSRSAAFLAVAAGTAFGGVALYLLAPSLGLADGIAANCARLGLSGASWLPFIAFIGLTNPWLEEVYWRGYLGSDATELLANDAWFGGYHVLILAPFVSWWWSAAAFVVLSGVAWVWRQSARLSGGVLVASVSHFAADVSILVAVWALTLR